MKFTEWLNESITPEKPKKVLTKSKIQNSGTNSAYKLYYKHFTTKLGNDVKVIFKPEYDGIKIDFQVNDSFKDDSATDPEILKNVIYVVEKELELKKYNIVNINASHRTTDGKNVHSRYEIFLKLIERYLKNYELEYSRKSSGNSDSIILKRKNINNSN